MSVQVTAEVVSLRRTGAYHHLTLVAPGIPEATRPGHFVALAVGGEGSGMLLRRAFSIHRVTPGGAAGGTVEVVFATHGKGTRWLADRRRGDKLDVIGPLGRPFTLPKEPVSCVLVAGGYGAAPLFMLSEQLRTGLPRGHGARGGDRGPALRRPGGQTCVGVGHGHDR